jgi:hypothetical protein
VAQLRDLLTVVNAAMARDRAPHRGRTVGRAATVVRRPQRTRPPLRRLRPRPPRAQRL